MNPEFKLQVPSDMYFDKYDDLDRFISYYHQINAVKKYKSARILEVGIGNGTVTSYLRRFGYDVTTCDFDAKLGPDHVADIRKLPFDEESFDVILAYEILEHIPIKDLDCALNELKRCCRKIVLLSVPYSAAVFEIQANIRLPRISKKVGFSIKVPFRFIKMSFGKRNREHYWELGRYGCSHRRLRNILKRYFIICNEYAGSFDSYHYYYKLQKQT